MSRTVAVFGSSAAGAGDGIHEAGMELGRLLAAAGMTVATGGYGGTMEAVSQGASEGGGRVIGVTAPELFPDRPAANAFVSDERHASTIATRICGLVDAADAFVVLPGSLGTATELMVAWNDVFVTAGAGRAVKPLVLLTSYWRPLVDLLVGPFGAEPAGIRWAETPMEAVRTIRAAWGSP